MRTHIELFWITSLKVFSWPNPQNYSGSFLSILSWKKRKKESKTFFVLTHLSFVDTFPHLFSVSHFLLYEHQDLKILEHKEETMNNLA